MLDTGYKFRDVSCIFDYFLVGTQAAVVAASDGDTTFVYEGYYNKIVTPLYLYIQHILSKSKNNNHKQDKEAKEGDVKNY